MQFQWPVCLFTQIYYTKLTSATASIHFHGCLVPKHILKRKIMMMKDNPVLLEAKKRVVKQKLSILTASDKI